MKDLNERSENYRARLCYVCCCSMESVSFKVPEGKSKLNCSLLTNASQRKVDKSSLSMLWQRNEFEFLWKLLFSSLDPEMTGMAK